MKKILSLVLVLALCLSMAATVLAADNYVPSIGDKQEPEIVPDGNKIARIIKIRDDSVTDEITTEDNCLVVTSVASAQNGGTAIPESAKAELLSVYSQLKDGSMKLPYEIIGKDASAMEIRDLFDVSLLCEEHNTMVANKELALEITFDLGIKAADGIYAMVYTNGSWVSVTECTNNGDGTVTVLFDEICPVAFCIEAKTPPAQTGDANRNTIAIYGTILAVSLVAIIVLFVVYRKKTGKK